MQIVLTDIVEKFWHVLPQHQDLRLQQQVLSAHMSHLSGSEIVVGNSKVWGMQRFCSDAF